MVWQWELVFSAGKYDNEILMHALSIFRSKEMKRMRVVEERTMTGVLNPSCQKYFDTRYVNTLWVRSFSSWVLIWFQSKSGSCQNIKRRFPLNCTEEYQPYESKAVVKVKQTFRTWWKKDSKINEFSNTTDIEVISCWCYCYCCFCSIGSTQPFRQTGHTETLKVSANSLVERADGCILVERFVEIKELLIWPNIYSLIG